jgi:hypothetical protein
MCLFEFASWDGRLYQVTRLKTFHRFAADQIAAGKPKTVEAAPLVASAPGSFD